MESSIRESIDLLEGALNDMGILSTPEEEVVEMIEYAEECIEKLNKRSIYVRTFESIISELENLK